MARRSRMSKRRSRRSFRAGANRTHSINVSGSRAVMRGGIRL